MYRLAVIVHIDDLFVLNDYIEVFNLNQWFVKKLIPVGKPFR